MTPEARQVIARLGLEPLPREGGFFRPTWRDAAGSAIYFLLTPEDFSAFHRLRLPELWHFHAGDPVEHVQLAPAGVRATRLGPEILRGDLGQVAVPAGVWQAARPAPPRPGGAPAPPCGWSLLGCTLAPPWDETAFELAERAALQREFPAAAEIVRALTR